MAGGPLFPFSAYPVSDETFPHIYVGDGVNSKEEEGLGLDDATAVAADAIWRLRYQMPVGSLPSGTCKLRITSLADAVTGVLKVNPKWASVAATEDPSSATLNAEGTTTITWATDDDDEYKVTEINLDADTPVADEIMVMDLTFEDTGMTLAVTSSHQAFVIWE